MVLRQLGQVQIERGGAVHVCVPLKVSEQVLKKFIWKKSLSMVHESNGVLHTFWLISMHFSPFWPITRFTNTWMKLCAGLIQFLPFYVFSMRVLFGGVHPIRCGCSMFYVKPSLGQCQVSYLLVCKCNLLLSMKKYGTVQKQGTNLTAHCRIVCYR